MGKDDFLPKIKDKAKELGFRVTDEIYQCIQKSTVLLPSIVGSDLVIATFVPMIPSLVYDIVKRELFEKNIPDLAELLKQNRNNLNLDFIQSPLGREIFQKTVNQMLEYSKQEKIRHLKLFLINVYSSNNPDEELIQNCQKILLNMEQIHIKLLTILRTPEQILRNIAEQRKQNPRNENQQKYGKSKYVLYWEPEGDDDINKFYLKSNNMVYRNGLKDLVTWNILQTEFQKCWVYYDTPTNFESNFQSHINEIKRWTTPFGKQFLDFIYEA